MSTQPKLPIFSARAQFLGTLKLLCPYCGNVGLHRIALGQWEIECKNDQCQRHMIIGLRVLIPSKVRASADRIPSDYTFPVVDVVPDPLRPGAQAHQIQMDHDDES